MSDTDKLDQIVENYLTLRGWCDGFFQKIRNKYENQMQCGEACDRCCSLQSVLPLEAAVIGGYLEDHPVETGPVSPGRCVFLEYGRCLIYPARPLICRTHGLILKDGEAGIFKRSCDLNFQETELSRFPSEDGLDATLITENLTRLNLAFCMVTGHDPAHERVALGELI